MRDGDEVEALTRPVLQWHAASAPFKDDDQTGDLGFVRVDGSTALAFAVDALGKGEAAASVAASARGYLERIAGGTPLEMVFRGCHEVLRGTRGVAMCVARFDARDDTLTWLSVGNIQGVLATTDQSGMPRYESLVMRGGVVGDRLPELRASKAYLQAGDMLVLATDGIEFGWHGEYRPGIAPRDLADTLLKKYCLGTDDAMALAVRYQGLEGRTSW